MKRTINSIAVLALLVSATACQEKLDTVQGDSNIGAYMNTDNASVTFAKSDQGGETFVEPRLSHVAATDMQVTVSVQDFLQQYNQINKTQYQSLPVSQYSLYEVDNPSNTSTNGKLTVTIKEGKISSKVGVRVEAMSAEKFPYFNKYAIPLRIVGTSGAQVLSNKDAVITFERPFKTMVPTIPKGQNILVNFADDVPESPEVTIQAQYMIEEWTGVNGTGIYYGGYYGRMLSSGIQIKDGGSDTPFHRPEGWSSKKWFQVTFVLTQDNKFRIYVNGKLEQTLDRAVIGISKEKKAWGFTLGNSATQYSHKYRVREVRFWNRALTEAEIKDNLYLPVDPNAEGLVAYLPLDNKEEGFVDKSKYKNEVKYGSNACGTGCSDKETFERGVEWTENVKFPAETLVIEE